MIEPVTTAALITGAAMIGSSLLSKGGSSGTANRKAARGQVRGTVQGAREAGLHPLAVLGGGTGGGFAQPTTFRTSEPSKRAPRWNDPAGLRKGWVECFE